MEWFKKALLITSCITPALLSGCTTHSSSVERIYVTGARSSAAMDEEFHPPPEQNRNDFENFDTNPVKLVSEAPVSTFSADVDTLSEAQKVLVHQATYEITPVGAAKPHIDKLRYTEAEKPDPALSNSKELAYLKMRYKLPGSSESTLIEQAIIEEAEVPQQLMQEVNFATAVAGFTQLLKDGKYIGDWGLDKALALAKDNRGEDEYGYRSEFVGLVGKVKD